MKHRITRFLSLFIVVLAFSTSNIVDAMMPQPPDPYPLRQIDYKQAFNQTAVYHQFGDLMTEQGCAHNVATDADDETTSCSCCTALVGLCAQGYRLLKTKKPLTQREQFEQACLDRLTRARRVAILKAADRGATSMALGITGAYGLIKWGFSPTSYGGSMTVAMTCEQSMYYTKEIVTSLVALKQPHQRLDDLEKEYAINKCFIPHWLWEKIEKHFEYARKGDDHQARYIDFLEFALHFTTLRPQPPLAVDIERIVATLYDRMDTFFSDYDITPWQLSLLKINIRNFVEQVTGVKYHPLRYVYLVGTGGIGKSEFVEQLHGWFEELMPGVVNFNKKVVDTAEALEGGLHQKGILLETYGEQLAHAQRGSIILLDDAEWFSREGSMASAAKRVFNGNLAEIKTTFFSQCDSKACTLPMPPMLVFATSNSRITDPFLDQRFDTIQFPENTKEALKKYGLELCERDSEYQLATARIQTAIRQELEREIESGKTIQDTPITTFRDVKLHVAPLCFYMTRECVAHAHYSGPHLKVD